MRLFARQIQLIQVSYFLGLGYLYISFLIEWMRQQRLNWKSRVQCTEQHTGITGTVPYNTKINDLITFDNNFSQNMQITMTCFFLYVYVSRGKYLRWHIWRIKLFLISEGEESYPPLTSYWSVTFLTVNIPRNNINGLHSFTLWELRHHNIYSDSPSNN